MAGENGADLLGVILVPGRSRTIGTDNASAISQYVSQLRLDKNPEFSKAEFFAALLESNHKRAEQLQKYGPFLVGVFQDQSVEEVLDIVRATGIDIVQLHGSEDKDIYVEELRKHGIAVIARYLVSELENGALDSANCVVPLLDSAKGGDGTTLDWNRISQLNQQRRHEFLLAGGLTVENVEQAGKVRGAIGVDVSSGIETNGVKDANKIREFIQRARDSQN